MSRQRKYGEDLTYAEEHRHRLPELYQRTGHRFDTCNRDWTEFCHHCKEPLLVIEEVRDWGQDLTDKGTTVTRRLAERASLPSYLMAWSADRPPAIQDEIDELNRRIRLLEAMHPITSFRARRLSPRVEPVVSLSPEQWWQHIAFHQRLHHLDCRRATRWNEKPVRVQTMYDLMAEHPLWSNVVPGQLVIPLLGRMAG